MPLSQNLRQASILTDLGKDAVVLERFSASERLSELFTILADVIAPEPVDFVPHLGSPVCVTMEEASVEGFARSFNGRLFEAQFTQRTEAGVHYRLVLRPWFALLSQNRNLRIFQTLSVKEIVQSVIDKTGFNHDFQWDGTDSYPKREYCVQFRESDFAFVSRLLEEEGLYYYFEHTPDRHILHVCDAPTQSPYAKGLATTPYIASEGSDKHDRPPHLWRWDEHVRPGAAKVTLRDYSFLQPNNDFEAEKEAGGQSVPAEQAELYDSPGGYGAYAVADMQPNAKRYAEARLDASRAERERYIGEGDAFALACGSRFSLEDYPNKDLDKEYLIVATTHVLETQFFRSGDANSDDGFDVDVEAIPSATRWRPPLKTPKPVAGGPQTATVVGPSGEVIHVDPHGRVKVQFHWDREGKRDDNSSCWIRVSQAWAENSFGVMMIPRIGSEVIVDFLDGDPDRPIVTGRVYNAERDPPHKLPDSKTMSTWMSYTVGDPGDYSGAEDPPPREDNFNEITFEDKGGSEVLYIYAGRELRTLVRLDENHQVYRDMHGRVRRDRITEVKRNETLVVETGDETREVQKGSRKTTIKKADTLTLKEGNSTTNVDSGNYSLTVSKGSVTIDAKTEILLKVGSNTLKLSPQGLEIKALTVKIAADTTLSVKGLTCEFKASTMLTINGMPVMIN